VERLPEASNINRCDSAARDFEPAEIARNPAQCRTFGGDLRLHTIILIGDDAAQAGDIVCRGKSPVFALCRALLAGGAHPEARLECYRGTTLALVIKSIGRGAQLTVKERDRGGLEIARWQPFPSSPVKSRIRQNGAAASLVLLVTLAFMWAPVAPSQGETPARAQPIESGGCSKGQKSFGKCASIMRNRVNPPPGQDHEEIRDLSITA
jgi:hypothetical protein